jgi:hypothetical protein
MNCSNETTANVIPNQLLYGQWSQGWDYLFLALPVSDAKEQLAGPRLILSEVRFNRAWTAQKLCQPYVKDVSGSTLRFASDTVSRWLTPCLLVAVPTLGKTNTISLKLMLDLFKLSI